VIKIKDGNALYSITLATPTISPLRGLTQEEVLSFMALSERAVCQPKKILKEVLQWSNLHPQIPEAANLIAYLYIRQKKLKKAERAIEAIYRKFPGYLIGRINYADLCLRQKKWEQIPQIFPHFTLKSLLPEKASFTLAEFRGFQLVMGFYHLAIDQKERAEDYLSLAQIVDPTHTATLLLEKRLRKRAPWWKKLF